MVAEQHRRAQRITRAATSYLQDYSVPLVAAARRDPASARTVAATDEGRRRVDAIRADFDGLMAVERGLAASRQDRSNAAARRAILATLGGLAGSVVLILVFTGYLTRAIVGPVRRAAVMAGRLAGGDLSVRMPERGVGEIGALERSFNSMAGALEDGRDQLGRLADEQAALRRVATLVAQRVPPVEVFATVAEEVGRLLGTEGAGIVRYEPDNTTTLVAGWSRDGDHMPSVRASRSSATACRTWCCGLAGPPGSTATPTLLVRSPPLSAARHPLGGELPDQGGGGAVGVHSRQLQAARAAAG